MTTTIIYRRRALLDDIADAAFVEADVMREKRTAHELHQLLDICEDDNLPLTLRLISLAFSEVMVILRDIIEIPTSRAGLSDADPFPVDFSLSLREDVSHIAAIRLKEAVHAFIVAFVIWHILASVDKQRADDWRQRAADALDGVKAMADIILSEVTPPMRRPLSPF